MRFQRLRKVGIAAFVLLVLAIAGFVIWAETPPAPLPSAEAALATGSGVQVDIGEYIVFRPLADDPRLGLILYPGGRVDPVAYAPLARAIAEQQFLVVIVPMPLNLAVLGYNRALRVEEAFPENAQWVVAGHSLGGAMAAHFAYKHPERVDGLVLWAAFSAEGDDLSGFDLPVLSISGSRDGLATPQDIAASRERLPASTGYLEIAGANHAQFGSYGAQRGDQPATISREQQQEQIAAATVAFLRELAGRP